MPDQICSLCAYWKTGQCILRNPPKRCTGHEYHFEIGHRPFQAEYSCSEMVLKIRNLIANEEQEELDQLLTGNSQIVPCLIKHILELNKGIDHG